jgi:anti-sigma regulatory factor (Ser/Thr protein kinase)
MSQLRSAAGAAALVDPRPASVIDALDRFARRTDQARSTTAFYGTIDPTAESFDYMAAGQPPPILVSPDGAVQVLENGRSWPLGVVDDPRTASPGHVPLPAGSLLVLYTDGLIERRGELLDAGIARLVAAVEDHWHRPTPEICRRLADELVPVDPLPAGDRDQHQDDVVIMAVRTAGSGPRHFTDVIPGVPDRIPATRRRLRDWLRSHSVASASEEIVLLAMSEAVTNAVEHGSRSKARLPVTIEASLDGPVLTACVRDHGGWNALPFAEPARDRGHGFKFMRTLADKVDVEGSADGSTVFLTMSLSFDP